MLAVCEESLAGGDEEVRTPDPLRARQVLSHLSYTPIPYRVPSVATLTFSESPSSRAFKAEQYYALLSLLPADLSLRYLLDNFAP